MNKDEIIAKLTELGIEHDPSQSPKKLSALLPDAGDESDEIVVKDPLVIRPVELPLVITLPASASKAQVEYAKTLNGYAYKNPEKWAFKKDDRTVDGKVVKGLITKLKELKNAPDPVEENLKFGKKNVI